MSWLISDGKHPLDINLDKIYEISALSCCITALYNLIKWKALCSHNDHTNLYHWPPSPLSQGQNLYLTRPADSDYKSTWWYIWNSPQNEEESRVVSTHAQALHPFPHQPSTGRYSREAAEGKGPVNKWEKSIGNTASLAPLLTDQLFV